MVSCLPIFALAVSTSVSADLPAEVHPSFRASLVEAIEADQQRDYQLSLALLHGIFYKDGVTIRLKNANGSAISKAQDQAVDSAVSVWKDALGKDCPIRITTDAGADVTVLFVDKVPRNSPDALGLIDLRKEYRWTKRKYEISISGTIYVQTAYEKRALSVRESAEVIAHEFGHLLGLDDLASPGQLMGPFVFDRPVDGPQPHESYAVQVLRYQAKKQWNAVIDHISTQTEFDSSKEFFTSSRQYLATCTVARGPRCGN